MTSQKILSLCSGIGGMELGANLANQKLGFEAFKPVALCEIAEYPRSILKLRYPEIPLFSDVRELTASALQARGIYRIDAIVAGVPCTTHSSAGAQKGLADKRDLFPDFFRIVGETRPKWALIENVPNLLSNKTGRDFRTILESFSHFGAYVRWDLVSCAEKGGIHTRKRLFIFAIFPDAADTLEH